MEITITNLQKKIPIPRAAILKKAKVVLRKIIERGHFKVSPFSQGSVSVTFVGVRRMRGINKKYKDHDFVTDVLTFDLGDNSAEIIICPQVAQTHARMYQSSTKGEIILYFVHGMLHLAGFDDRAPQDARAMRRMEEELL